MNKEWLVGYVDELKHDMISLNKLKGAINSTIVKIADVKLSALKGKYLGEEYVIDGKTYLVDRIYYCIYPESLDYSMFLICTNKNMTKKELEIRRQLDEISYYDKEKYERVFCELSRLKNSIATRNRYTIYYEDFDENILEKGLCIV